MEKFFVNSMLLFLICVSAFAIGSLGVQAYQLFWSMRALKTLEEINRRSQLIRNHVFSRETDVLISSVYPLIGRYHIQARRAGFHERAGVDTFGILQRLDRLRKELKEKAGRE